MTVEQIEREALALSEPERVGLLAKLWATLPMADEEITDEEVARRDSGLASGEVSAVSHDEFVRHVLRERGQ